MLMGAAVVAAEGTGRLSRTGNGSVSRGHTRSTHAGAKPGDWVRLARASPAF